MEDEYRGFEKIIFDGQGNFYYDPDSSPDAWKHYNEFYKSHWELFLNFNTQILVASGTPFVRLLSCIKKENERIVKLGNDIDEFYLGGECDFNFNKKKYNILREILKDDDVGMEMLYRCHAMHCTVLNFSIMAVTGGMNNVKGMNKLDRLDSFVRKLNDFYANKTSNNVNNFVPAWQKRNEKQVNRLKNYLLTFEDIYEYCEKIYFINDRNFVDELITQGGLYITNVEEAKRYMTLANDYWSLKKQSLLAIRKNQLHSYNNYDIYIQVL